MMRARVMAVVISCAAFLSASPDGYCQAPGLFSFADYARKSLAEPFVGITTDGRVQQGLFAIQRTGVTTAPVRRAAESLLDALSPAQQARIAFPVDDAEWRNWANIHRFPRQGVSLDEMDEAQRAAAYELLRTALSAKGYQTARDIMRLNHHLAELVVNFDEYGEHLYWFTIMGTPSDTEPWGWQLDGHHLIINYFVLGDQIVMTPTFMGSEPVRSRSGRYAGTAVLQHEQDLGLAFMQSLSDSQRAQAVIDTDKRRSENLAELFRDNVVVTYQGIPATGLDTEQRRLLLALISEYITHMDDGHAAVKLDEVRTHLDNTWFAWKGGTASDDVFYYCIHSPVIFIEFDHQGRVALPGPRDAAIRYHIHSVVRTPNGNDYGKDLLRQHYEAYRNDPGHGHKR
jgi:hypothetical protein